MAQSFPNLFKIEDLKKITLLLYFKTFCSKDNLYMRYSQNLFAFLEANIFEKESKKKRKIGNENKKL